MGVALEFYFNGFFCASYRLEISFFWNPNIPAKSEFGKVPMWLL
jgi:hypothetical protein